MATTFLLQIPAQKQTKTTYIIWSIAHNLDL